MNQQELRNYLDKLISRLNKENKTMLTARLESLVSAFPFNEYEYILMYLLDKSVIEFDEYEKLRENYVLSNRYLHLYGLAPRIFGQIWGEKHLMDLDTRFIEPDRSIDPNYEGEYDLWAQGVRIEVKACRAIHTKKRGNLAEKALEYDSANPFWMNFQQLKPDACDAFVFIGVWIDRIIYWVLSRDDVKLNKYLSHQHRGGIEYQIGITHKNISDFEIFKIPASEIYDKIISKGRAT